MHVKALVVALGDRCQSTSAERQNLRTKCGHAFSKLGSLVCSVAGEIDISLLGLLLRLGSSTGGGAARIGLLWAVCRFHRQVESLDRCSESSDASIWSKCSVLETPLVTGSAYPAV